MANPTSARVDESQHERIREVYDDIRKRNIPVSYLAAKVAHVSEMTLQGYFAVPEKMRQDVWDRIESTYERMVSGEEPIPHRRWRAHESQKNSGEKSVAVAVVPNVNPTSSPLQVMSGFYQMNDPNITSAKLREVDPKLGELADILDDAARTSDPIIGPGLMIIADTLRKLQVQTRRYANL